MAMCLVGVAIFSSCGKSDNGEENNGGDFGTLPATNGKFTLTGADAYNGQFAYAQGLISTGSIYGATGTIYEMKGIQIQNGKVELPMYYTSWSPVVTTAYSGNDLIAAEMIGEFKMHNFLLYIMPTADPTYYVDMLDAHSIVWDEVQFSNGSVTKDASEGTYN